MLWTEWELDHEDTDYLYRPPPAVLKDITDTDKPAVTANGHAEVKPHHEKGIFKGLKQLDDSTATGSKFLITYRPVSYYGQPVYKGRPYRVQVFLTAYPNPRVGPMALLKQQWWNLGTFNPAAPIVPSMDNSAIFGYAVETAIRNLVNTKLLRPDRKMKPGTGGALTGPDILWDELAEFYGELGRQTGDPFYAELAASLR